MILPIYVYGQPVLRKVAEDITPDYPNLKELICSFDSRSASAFSRAACSMDRRSRSAFPDLSLL